MKRRFENTNPFALTQITFFDFPALSEYCYWIRFLYGNISRYLNYIITPMKITRAHDGL